MNIHEIEKMSTTERLQTMEALWDSLLQDESVIKTPEWHEDILKERMLKIENGNAVEKMGTSRRLTLLKEYLDILFDFYRLFPKNKFNIFPN